MRQTSIAALLFLGVCYAQSSQPPVTADELIYLRFVLLNVASLDHDPAAIKTFEDTLAKRYQLTTQESAAIHSAGQNLNLLLAQNRRLSQSIIANKQSLSDDDRAALANLDAEREQTIANLANIVLNAVRSGTAALLRTPGQVLANTIKQN